MSESGGDCDLRQIAAQIRPFMERRVASADVDDVVQDILARVYGGIDALDDDTRFVAWLHRVARNAIVDHHRRRERGVAKHDAFVAEWQDETVEREDALASLAIFVRAFVATMPSPYREALQLTKLDGLTMQAAVPAALAPRCIRCREPRRRAGGLSRAFQRGWFCGAPHRAGDGGLDPSAIGDD